MLGALVSCALVVENVTKFMSLRGAVLGALLVYSMPTTIALVRLRLRLRLRLRANLSLSLTLTLTLTRPPYASAAAAAAAAAARPRGARFGGARCARCARTASSARSSAPRPSSAVEAHASRRTSALGQGSGPADLGARGMLRCPCVRTCVTYDN